MQGKSIGGGQKSSPHQKWLIWFIMDTNTEKISESYVFVLA